MVGRGEAAEAPPQKVLLAELMRRDNFMFSGATGAVVASGGTLATSAPTYGLIKDVIELVDDACRTRSLIGVHSESTGRAACSAGTAPSACSSATSLGCRRYRGRWPSRLARPLRS